MKPQKEGPKAINGVMESVLKKLGLETRFKESQVAVHWKSWVGDSIANHTQPYRVVQKKLVVYVDNSVWLTELNRYYRTWILKRIQTVLGKEIIRDIHFKIGEIPAEPENKEKMEKGHAERFGRQGKGKRG